MIQYEILIMYFWHNAKTHFSKIYNPKETKIVDDYKYGICEALQDGWEPISTSQYFNKNNEDREYSQVTFKRAYKNEI